MKCFNGTCGDSPTLAHQEGDWIFLRERREAPVCIAVLSEIHGNCFALDRVLADICEQGVEQIIYLGDAIQGGARPAETVSGMKG